MTTIRIDACWIEGDVQRQQERRGRGRERRGGREDRNRYKGKEIERNYTLPFRALPALISDSSGRGACGPVQKGREAHVLGGVTMGTGDKYTKGNYALFTGRKADGERSIRSHSRGCC